MIYELIFTSTIVMLITIKLKDISLRHKLSASKERRLLLSGGLVILFLLSSVFLPFPESLYWFIVLGLSFTVILISLDIIKLELKRQRTLPIQERVTNLLFYSLFIVFVTIWI